jgi:lipocalin-like protein
MTRVSPFALALIILSILGGAMPAREAAGQQKTLKEQLVGTWTYVSVDIVRPDGSHVPLYGPNPSGIATFDANGHYVLLTARTDIPRFASNNRNDGTPEENRAVVQGSIAHFGTYNVNESDKTITFHVQTSTFPNWNGAEQKRPFTVTASELKWITAASSGGTAEVVLRRAN